VKQGQNEDAGRRGRETAGVEDPAGGITGIEVMTDNNRKEVKEP
jgi:hypothetical protein